MTSLCLLLVIIAFLAVPEQAACYRMLPYSFVPPRSRAIMCAGPCQPLVECMTIPEPVADSLTERGLTLATPIQQQALSRAATGESMVLHSETGSGKTLAMMLPALLRVPDSKVLILSPTRELVVQLGDEAAKLLKHMDKVSRVKLVAQGHKAKPTDMKNARVVIGTPAEMCELLMANDGTQTRSKDRRTSLGHYAELLGNSVSTVILDEIDALIPGRKEFKGKRHSKWMDKGMFPAEGIVKMMSRRATRDDFQVLAASATLDKATRRKLDRLLRTSSPLQARMNGTKIPVVSIKEDGTATEKALSQERLTTIPSEIQLKTVKLNKTDGVVEAAKLAQAVHDSRPEGSTLVFVSSRSTYLGGTNEVRKLLKSFGMQVYGLSDALWPTSTRAVKRRAKSDQHMLKEAAANETESRKGLVERSDPASERRSDFNEKLHVEKKRPVIVSDAATTRGLHLDTVSTVVILGLPANQDTYLHLAGRTGRWPREGGDGTYMAVTIAKEGELKELRGWCKDLGASVGPMKVKLNVESQ